MPRRIVYRVCQFLRAMLGRVRKDEVVVAGTHLSASQMALFHRMHRIDQRHCLDVFYTLHQAGHRDPALLQAALLHDVGKAAGRITIFHRVAVVLLPKIVPGGLDRLARDGRGWWHAFTIHVSHPEISARWTEASSSPEVVLLIQRHHDPNPQDERLAALHWADGQN